VVRVEFGVKHRCKEELSGVDEKEIREEEEEREMFERKCKVDGRSDGITCFARLTPNGPEIESTTRQLQ
ncbi:hypothetical protein SK128_020892, partial [Halocaridina rubra]